MARRSSQEKGLSLPWVLMFLGEILGLALEGAETKRWQSPTAAVLLLSLPIRRSSSNPSI